MEIFALYFSTETFSLIQKSTVADSISDYRPTVTTVGGY